MIGKGMVYEIGDLANFSSNIKSRKVWLVTRVPLLLEFTLQRANDFIVVLKIISNCHDEVLGGAVS